MFPYLSSKKDDLFSSAALTARYKMSLAMISGFCRRIGEHTHDPDHGAVNDRPSSIRHFLRIPYSLELQYQVYKNFECLA